MVKKLSLTFFIFTIILTTKILAQTWPMPEAKWTYCLTNANGAPAGEIIFIITGDTVIEGKSYSIIEEELESSKGLNIDKGMRTLFTRYENDTVYRFVNNQEYLYFTFNLNVGDVFSTYRTSGWWWNDSTCSSILPLKVIDIDEIELSGQIFTKYILEDTLFQYLYEPSYPDPITYVLVDRIGVINTFPFLNVMEGPDDCWLLTDYGEVRLGKYVDNSFEHTFDECEGVGVNQFNDNNMFTVFPNPVQHILNISYSGNLSDEYEISLINLFGQNLFSIKMNVSSIKIDLSKYPKGTYVLSVRNKKNTEKKFQLIII